MSLDFRATANAEADLGVRDEAKAVGEIEFFDSSLNRIMKGQEKLLMKMSGEAQTTAEAKGKRATNGTLRARLEERKAVRQFYRKLPPTEEWAENNYYQLPIDQQNANLILINAFWNDFASHPEGEPFVSGNFIYATRNFSEMMFALSVLDLPFEPVDHEVENKGSAFSLKSDQPLLLFHQEIGEAKNAKDARDILLSQNFYRADSRYVNEGGERLDNFVKDEFLKQIAYGCQVVITNPTSSVRKLRYLAQIPTGAMPLQNGFYSDGRPVPVGTLFHANLRFLLLLPRDRRLPGLSGPSSE